MCGQKQTCADKFLVMVTEGVFHSVYKIVTLCVVFRYNMATLK